MFITALTANFDVVGVFVAVYTNTTTVVAAVASVFAVTLPYFITVLYHCYAALTIGTTTTNTTTAATIAAYTPLLPLFLVQVLLLLLLVLYGFIS